MGKNLKGKECGKGIRQRKIDGYYSARFVDRNGKRQEKYFQNLPEARSWLEEMKYTDKHQDFPTKQITVDEWFTYWIKNIVGDLAPNTIRNYRERYISNVKPVIGNIPLADLKPMHCKKIFIKMDPIYAGSTIRQTYIMLGTMLKAAKMNDLIAKHPLDTVRFTKTVRAANDIQFFTRDEQRLFLEMAQHTLYYKQYVLLLDTGLRTGELTGMTWDVIDFDKKTITVNKTLEYRYEEKSWRAGPPKTLQSYRTIPLTDRAYNILKELWDNRTNRKEAPLLTKTLDYIDKKTGTLSKLVMHDLVFIHPEMGEPVKNSTYDSALYRICSKIGIPEVSMHDLRHTYATRAIESGMQPKVLQKLLGHSSIKITMDRYVHVTEDSLEEAIRQFQDYDVLK